MNWCSWIRNALTAGLVLSIFLLWGCASSEIYNSGAVPPVDSSEYEDVLEKFTRHDRQYSGFYQTYEVKGTLLNSEVNRLILQNKGFYHQWDAEKARKEREKTIQEMSSESSFFFSFFTPERDHNDLNKGTSIWKVYLEVNGVRYDGRVVKRNDKLADLVTVYHYHNRWSTPYKVYFKIPMTAVEQASSKIVFTSSLGTTTFEFPSIK
ncbi:MAG: hypothetical protein H6624_10435 [Bdellovibrionaceae bacterium]|nr:hypothetical protein [Bdellovibrionales bacterium]MCB9084752.1 hypothetical protein [Pseudobdellovibrionaceae bacterium]